MTVQLDTGSIAAAKALVPGAFTEPRDRRFRRIALGVAFVVLTAWCLYDFDFSPVHILQGLGRLGSIFAFMFPPYLWQTWEEWSEILEGLLQTVSMAFMGTLLGAIFAFPLALLGARNIIPLPWLRLSSRRAFDALRAVEQIILALIFIRAFGLGPLAGILAIAVSEIGTLAKLFSEAIENTSTKPVDGVKAAGGDAIQAIRFGIVPQALPVILSIVLYNFESNTRSGTILGVVGAGGIGFLLSDRINAYRWPEAWSIIFLIIVMVYIIDGISGRLRMQIIGRTETPR